MRNFFNDFDNNEDELEFEDGLEFFLPQGEGVPLDSLVVDLFQNSLYYSVWQRPVPPRWLSLCLANLSYLDLSENQLSGSPFDILLDLANLDYLYLHDNQFSGYIPVTVSANLYAITAGDNQFCPPYPYCFVYAEYQDISNCP